MKLAAIDCGTNSFHLLVARVGADGVIEPLDRAKEMVRLGDSAFGGGGVLSAEMTREAAALVALRRLVAPGEWRRRAFRTGGEHAARPVAIPVPAPSRLIARARSDAAPCRVGSPS